MNFRQTAILLVGVIVVGVVLLILTSGENATETDSLTEEFPSTVKPENIDTVEIEREGGGKLKLVRNGPADKHAWDIVEPYHATADGNTVEAVIAALMKARPIAHPELTSSLSFHGLEPPSLKVTLRQGTDKASTVSFGNVSPSGKGGVAFVTTSKRPNRPMAVNRADVDALFKEPKDNKPNSGKAGELAKWVADYRAHNIFPGDSRAFGMDVVSLKLSLPNKKKELALSQTSEGWKFDVPAGWGNADAEGDVATALNTFNGVNPLIRTLTSMNVASADGFIENPGDLAQYGLNPDNPDIVRVEMKTKDKTTVVFIGQVTEDKAPDPKPQMPGMPPQPPTAGSKAYVMVEGQPGVIRATAGNLKGLASIINDPNPLRDRDLLTLDPRKLIDGYDISVSGQQTKLRRVGLDWKLFGGPGEAKAWKPFVDQLEGVVAAKRAIKEFTTPKPEDFNTISATLSVWADGFTQPPAAAPNAEPAPKSPPVKPTTLEFGRKDGDVIHVRRTLPNGQQSTFTVPAMLRVGTDSVDVLAVVSKTRLDLLDRSLPSFSDTPKISVAGAEANYTLAQDEKPDPITGEKTWRFVSPDPRAGKTASGSAVRNDIVYVLATAGSHFNRYVSENPTPAELAAWGFTPNPKLKATVDVPASKPPVGAPPKTPAPENKPLVFEFGNIDGDTVYARIGGQGPVFKLGKTVYERLVKADLRDRVVFRFDPAQVTTVEFRGWQNLGLGEQKMKLVKNASGGWDATVNEKPASFALDPLKVDQFLHVLTQERVKTFIATNFQKDEYGFGKDFLTVDLTFREGPKISMNIGSLTDNNTSYFVFSSTLPSTDPFCTLEAEPLKPFKAGPTGFEKK